MTPVKRTPRALTELTISIATAGAIGGLTFIGLMTVLSYTPLGAWDNLPILRMPLYEHWAGILGIAIWVTWGMAVALPPGFLRRKDALAND